MCRSTRRAPPLPRRSFDGSVLTGQSYIDIRTVRETGSTNADLLILAADGACEGIWLRAERQQGGRGRLGRPWHGEEGNLYTSTLVRLHPEDPPAPSLALLAAIAVHDALSAVAPETVFRIKWPNDIMVGSAKISGMLLERAGEAVVVGIGINVTHHPVLADRDTTCLHALGRAEVSAQLLIELVAARFADYLQLWRSGGVAVMRSLWLARAHAPGTMLRASLPDGNRVDGTFETLDSEGNLIMRLVNGQRKVIHAGDIFLL